MLPKKQRLNRTGFLVVFSTGRRHHTPHLTLILTPAPEFRCSVVVGKKVAKKAHARNWLKRQIYQAVASLPNKQKFACIILAKPSLISLTKQQLATALVKEIALLSNNQ